MSSMAPRLETKTRIRATIRERIAARRLALEMTEIELARKLNTNAVNIRRWEGTAKEPTTPALDDARRLADALGVTLDWLTGREMTAADQAASVAAWAEHEVEAMRVRLDRLVEELTNARSALITDDMKIPKAVGRVSREQHAEEFGEPVTVSSEATG